MPGLRVVCWWSERPDFKGYEPSRAGTLALVHVMSHMRLVHNNSLEFLLEARDRHPNSLQHLPSFGLLQTDVSAHSDSRPFTSIDRRRISRYK